jgi:hypothetical protein
MGFGPVNVSRVGVVGAEITEIDGDAAPDADVALIETVSALVFNK